MPEYDINANQKLCKFNGCAKGFDSKLELSMREHTDTFLQDENDLKFSLIDEVEGVYFVRMQSKGPDFKVHVNLKLVNCSNLICSENINVRCVHLESVFKGVENIIEARQLLVDEDFIHQLNFF